VSHSPSNNCTIASVANSGLLLTAPASVGPPSALSNTVTLVSNSRRSLTESVGHCVERPMAVDSVRIAGNCVAPTSLPTSSSLSNHSSAALRGLGPACASTAVSFSSTPLLKSAGSAIHRMESVARLLNVYHYYTYYDTHTHLVFTAQCSLVQSTVLRSYVIHPSVTMVDCDHIGWKSWKLIPQTISQTPSLFVAKRRSTYSEGNMGKFWGD